MKGIPLIVYAITSLHVGMGRSSGVVDLPIQRDPEGFPIIFSSSFKGALKQFCGQKFNAFNKNGRIDCNKASVCCCLLGGEEESNADVTSIISLSDLYPLLMPIPSLDMGYVYLTSKYLINTIKDLFNAVDYKDGISFLTSLESAERKNKVIVGIDLEVPLVNISQSNMASVLTNLGSIAGKLKEGVAVEDDDGKAVLEMERGIIKYTRNKINYETGTVAEHSLWTEEYIPHGTIFAGIIFFNVPRRNKYCGSDVCNEDCAKEKIKEFLSDEFYMNVGGKESIGKGIIRVKLLF
ncbi:type III-B CRISPR module RAMP protein Cmr4 [Sulfolobus sp. S-194]|uniref:type III-B CRISPR module RAMP protein Cmr4 n=1 Tax=Sulfolobus sp. S-194 TaxID=2512240 RepID=UPI0014371130|nr:type III-B CRISPR module RAMP protein Cmr4 [Sulfolobus sp. S-194]QIW22855.1 type III-B CRISPR module RAMP protein Cmr4 [Sulfolobus sp. S-194]